MALSNKMAREKCKYLNLAIFLFKVLEDQDLQ